MRKNVAFNTTGHTYYFEDGGEMFSAGQRTFFTVVIILLVAAAIVLLVVVFVRELRLVAALRKEKKDSAGETGGIQLHSIREQEFWEFVRRECDDFEDQAVIAILHQFDPARRDDDRSLGL